MTKFTTYPRCEKHKLLRTLAGGRVVVSSAALYTHLGNERYQKFIGSVVSHHEPYQGFWPETVEKFLGG